MLWVVIGTRCWRLNARTVPAASWDASALTWWFLGMLALVYLAFSMVQISYQAYGAEISDDPVERTRVTAFREGLGLIGVPAAALLRCWRSPPDRVRAMRNLR